MTENPNPQEPEDIRPEDQGDGSSAGQGPEAHASGPEPHGGETDASATDDEELTVQDILDAAEADSPEGADAENADPESEHLASLRRVTAEYANYRKRTEANREVERERTTGDVVKLLLPVLDDLDRAEKHGDLAGDAPFAQIATKLRSSIERLGLRPFAEKGEVFDPNIHEAIFQQPSPDATGETILDVVETGYFVGGTLLRAAKVVVQVPAS